MSEQTQNSNDVAFDESLSKEFNTELFLEKILDDDFSSEDEQDITSLSSENTNTNNTSVMLGDKLA